MRVSAATLGVTGGKLRAYLALSAAVFFLLVAGPRPSGAAVSAEGFSVATSPENETSAAVSGNTAVWSTSGAGGDIQGKNLSTGADLNLPSQPGVQTWPDVSGRIVVWQDTSSGDSDIWGYDLDAPSGGPSAPQPFPVAVGPGNQIRPAVDGGIVVWEDDRNGNRDVYGFDVNTGQERPIATAAGNQRNPDVGGGVVAWENTDATDSDVVARVLASGTLKTIASDSRWQDSPAVDGDVVVWCEERVEGNNDIYGYDLAKGREFEVAVTAENQYQPAVAGGVATWAEDASDGSANVRGRDLSTGDLSTDRPLDLPFEVSPKLGQNLAPAVSGETVVWEVDRGEGGNDLLGARLDRAPAAPGGLIASGTAAGVALDWATSSEPDVRGYNVYRSGTEGVWGEKLNTSGPIPADSSSFDDPGAPPGERSYYRVTAVDAAGSESGAARASVVTAPGAPTIGATTARDKSAVVAWTPPAGNGSAPISEYRVQVVDAATGATVKTVPGVPGDATSTLVDGLTNGTAYKFQVLAVNSAGAGSPSAYSNTVTPSAPIVVTAPSAPAIGAATAGNASATVSWTAPAKDGGAPITEYRVQVVNAATGATVKTVPGVPGTATSASITGLTNGTSYKFRVRAVNSAGLSPFSAYSNTVKPAAAATVTAPGAPTIGTASSGVTTDTAITATARWNMTGVNTGGRAITEYRVQVFTATGTTSLGNVLVLDDNATSASISRLNNGTVLQSGTSYRFRVQASNTPDGQANVWGPLSAFSNAVRAQ